MTALSRDAILVEVATCLADPDRADGDGALLVLADRLMLSDDVANVAIGELIAAQLSPGKRPSGKRMKELARAAVRAWVGPLADAVDPRSVGFLRGVPASARLRDGLTSRSPLRERDPLWPILAAIDLDRASIGRLTALLPRLVRAARVEGALPEVVGYLRGDARPPAMTALACQLGRTRTSGGALVDGELFEAACVTLAEDAALVELRHGDPFLAAVYTWLAHAPLTGRLASLSVANLDEARLGFGALALEPWLAWLGVAAGPALARFELTEHTAPRFAAAAGWTIVITRGAPDGAFDTLHATYVSGSIGEHEPPARRLASALRRVPAGAISRLAYGTVPGAIRNHLHRLGVIADQEY